MAADDWRMIDHSPNIALTLAWQWSIAVRAQTRRVAADEVDAEQVPNLYLLVIAIRNVRRAAAMAFRNLAKPESKARLRAALRTFDTMLPGADAARNVIEHFDDYSRGVGDLQQPDVRRPAREPDEQMAQAFVPTFDRSGSGPSQLRIHCGPHTVDLSQASEAAGRLVVELREAILLDEAS